MTVKNKLTENLESLYLRMNQKTMTIYLIYLCIT